MADTTEVTLHHHDAAAARARLDDLTATYRAAYVGTRQEHDPFYSAERFAERFAGYTSAPGFELVTAEAGDEIVGYIFGYTLPVGARWWNGLLDPVPAGFTEETGARTFALNELHVREDWRGRHIASQLHAELAKGRPEPRLTILVRPENPARSTYLHWGYKLIGRLQPFPDSPVYDSLVLERGTRRACSKGGLSK